MRQPFTGSLCQAAESAMVEAGLACGVELRRLMRVFVEPQADRDLWLPVCVPLILDQGEGRGLCFGPYQ